MTEKKTKQTKEADKQITKPTVHRNKPQSTRRKTPAKMPLRVIPVGGLHEIGKNMTLLEYGDDMIMIDCGMAFPDENMLGIDVVIPDFSYVVENAQKLRGVIITHAHEDHIGAIPYLLQQLDVPIFASKLTLGFIKHKLEERNVAAKFQQIEPGDTFNLGCFKIEAIHITHSVADALCYCIETPIGKVFHTGDFKVDFTPVDSDPIDLAKFAKLGKEGILFLMADSTNSGRKGYTPSERVVGLSLAHIFPNIKGRIIIATFSSNVHRLQKIIDIAAENGRKVAISGRSMENTFAIATELGYLHVPANTIVDVSKIKSIPDNELVVITTGSQGEPMSALARMASDEHKTVKIRPGDTIILSSTPVPGNEKSVTRIVNELLVQGASVIYNDIAETHVSGHACEEELKLIHSLLKPKFFMPVHGEVKHLISHAEIAKSLGMPEENIVLAENGAVIELTKRSIKLTEERIPAHAVMVDGLGIGDVGSAVLNERKVLSEGGIIVVSASFDSATGELLAGPEIHTRGVVFVKEYRTLIEEAEDVMYYALLEAVQEGKDKNGLRNLAKETLRDFMFRKLGRNPIVLPIFLYD